MVVDETTLTGDDTKSFAGAFTPVFGADGVAAADGGVTYALGIAAGSTGLFDTATGLEIVLSVSNGQVFGKVGALTVFVVSVDNAGQVTLDQQRAVVHDDPNDSIETGAAAATLASDGLITLTATATDKDGDHASATIGIGQNLQFEDDGPSITAPGAQPALVVDETTLSGDDTKSFAGAFTPVFGAGGVTYALSIAAGSTGLFDTATGLEVVLSVSNGQVVGKAGAVGPTVFVVSVDSAGQITLDQQRAVVHDDPTDGIETGAAAATLASDGLITLTAIPTDKDGDHASATIGIGQNLQFEDDGPNANGTAQAKTVDEDGDVVGTGNTGGPGDDDLAAKTASGNVSAIFGAGADGVGSYSLSNDPAKIGLLPSLTSQGGQVLYDVTGNTLTAYVNGLTAGYTPADDREVFTLDLNVGGTPGAFLFTLIDQLDHPVTDNPATIGTAEVAWEDELTLNLGAILKVTDKDGDSAYAAANKLAITADDDSPVITTLDSANDITYDNADNPNPGGNGVFAYRIGFDDRDSYSASSSDLLLSFASGDVGGSAITNKSVSWVSESDAQATFNFSFTYLSNPADNTSATNATGSLSFDKAAGTYHVSLNAPISSYTILSLSDPGVGFTGYLANSSTTTNSQPPVSVAALASSFYVQFNGTAEDSGGTDGNTATKQALFANNHNLDALTTNEAWSNGDDDAFTPGELFGLRYDADPGPAVNDKPLLSWVSVSGSAAGVAGDTMQNGEVLDFTLWSGNPKGFLDPSAANPPLNPVPVKVSASTVFMQFDALDNGEDLVVVLKLVNPNNPNDTTTRAVIVGYGDIYHNTDINQLPASFGFTGTLDNNDGFVVIESNDYNGAGETWHIQGAQVLASTEGISGQGVNLVRAIGAGGGSSVNGVLQYQNLDMIQDSGPNNGGTWDGDVFKITNIGFITSNTQTADAHLDFGVQVADYDGDKTDAQTFSINIVGDSSANATSSSLFELVPLSSLEPDLLLF
ncbi:hypothetical protein KRR38_33440 [Novosphingobium sp. G106]|uniref:DUF5801 repeats-in-toxin domain-containing protein n=1 Tax=Novosphingobium sp. G106 TaxID=2849500 RepID=UPI001C2D9CC4|nr:hypothetical protein [Novosphingobium sp. G106]